MKYLLGVVLASYLSMSNVLGKYFRSEIFITGDSVTCLYGRKYSRDYILRAAGECRGRIDAFKKKPWFLREASIALHSKYPKKFTYAKYKGESTLFKYLLYNRNKNYRTGNYGVDFLIMYDNGKLVDFVTKYGKKISKCTVNEQHRVDKQHAVNQQHGAGKQHGVNQQHQDEPIYYDANDFLYPDSTTE